VTESDNDRAHEALSLAIDKELQQARDRAASLEQRALAVVTTSGVLVSLVFGFSAVIKGKEITHLPIIPKALLSLALISFVAAAAISLFTIMPRRYSVESEWKELLKNWIKSPSETWTAVINLHLRENNHWQDTNTTKAKYLVAAIVAECAGIGLLAASMLVIILLPVVRAGRAADLPLSGLRVIVQGGTCWSLRLFSPLRRPAIDPRARTCMRLRMRLSPSGHSDAGRPKILARFATCWVIMDGRW
jgi:hypothetical protein